MQESPVRFLGWEDLWRRDRLPTPVFLGFPCGSAGKESAHNVGNLGSIPGLGRSPGEGKGYPLQYSGLENPMDYTVHGVTKSWTWLSDFHFQTEWGKLYSCPQPWAPTGTHIKNGKGDSTKSRGRKKKAKFGNLLKHPNPETSNAALEGHQMTLLSPDLRHSAERGEKPTYQGPEGPCSTTWPPLSHGSLYLQMTPYGQNQQDCIQRVSPISSRGIFCKPTEWDFIQRRKVQNSK